MRCFIALSEKSTLLPVAILLVISIVFFTAPQQLNLFQKEYENPHNLTILTDQVYFNPIIGLLIQMIPAVNQPMFKSVWKFLILKIIQ